ncbi:MAG: CBS domain-containing protein [Gemmatimonadetes bacterium]|nr:CBS domain-containing protein [Gemmatimonadota bacterium]
MRVRNLLHRKTSEVVTVGESDAVSHAVRVLLDRGVGGLAVVDEYGALTGFLSERDVVDALNRHSGDVRNLQVAHVMRRPPVCGMEDDVTVVMQRMTSERLRHLVAVDQGRPVGVISVGDIVKQRLVELEMETGVLRDYVAGQRAV